MKNKIVAYVILIILVITTFVFISEVVSFIGIFFGLLVAMGYFLLKGIMLNDISYSLFLLSFLLFFLFLSMKKGKVLLLIISLILFFAGLTEKLLIFSQHTRILSTTIGHNSQEHNKAQHIPTKTFVYPSLNYYKDSISMKEQRQKVKFEEYFDAQLLDNWLIQRYTFSENGCEMRNSQILLQHSMLILEVGLNEGNKAKPYKGGEIGSVFSLLYGKFTVRMKNQITSGTVSSFFLMNKWQPENWEHKEIDIEFLGKNTSAVQFTVHDFKDGGRNHIYKEYTYSLGFDSSDDFHDYSILWDKDSISWLVDDKLVHTEKEILINEEMYIRLNHWAANTSNNDFVNWLGSVDVEKLPSVVYYDYIKYFPLL